VGWDDWTGKLRGLSESDRPQSGTKHKTRPRAPGGLADRLGVVAVVLGALDEGLHVLRWDQAHVVAEGGQFPCPMVRTGARFHRDLGWQMFLKERQHLSAAVIDTQHRLISLVDAVQCEHSLGRVNTNAPNPGHTPKQSLGLTELLVKQPAKREAGCWRRLGRPELLDQINVEIASTTADGAYDGEAVYDAVAERHSSAMVIIP
jgi:hypothetical protein